MFTIKQPKRYEGLSGEKRDVSVVIPGEVITTDTLFMRGHGTLLTNQTLTSTLAGTLTKTNKLLTIHPLNQRYQGDIGDVIIGRITDIGPSRWKADIGSRQDAVLLLSSVMLPGGVQRRKSEHDALVMETFFKPGELFSQFFGDGAASVHTRSIKYGKLRNGSLVIVPSPLVKRSKSHFLALEYGVDLILGMNGYIWVSMHVEVNPEDEFQPETLYSTENQVVSMEMRECISRVCNCITVLARFGFQISDTSIVYAYEVSLGFRVDEILGSDVGRVICEAVKGQMDVHMDET